MKIAIQLLLNSEEETAFDLEIKDETYTDKELEDQMEKFCDGFMENMKDKGHIVNKITAIGVENHHPYYIMIYA